MLPLTIELRRSTGPATSNESRRVEQVPEDRLELDPRDVRAHAEVLAEPEREVGVRAAIDAERERIVEDLLVAVRRREVQRDLLSGADRRPRTSQSSVAVRVKWLIGLTQRRISSTASGSSSGRSRSFSHSPRCSEKASSPPLIALRVVSLPASTSSSQYDDELLLGERRLRRSRLGSARSPGRPGGCCGAASIRRSK